jgi:3-phenylpropionate/trans-cinnamate dioxygenase ferredoxin reductase subunit
MDRRVRSAGRRNETTARHIRPVHRHHRLLIATGTPARPWFNPQERALDGLFTLRTSDDAARLQAALKAGPNRVLIVDSGFIGSEMASVCRELGLPVTVAERAEAPLVGPLGGVIGEIAARLQRRATSGSTWSTTTPTRCRSR